MPRNGLFRLGAGVLAVVLATLFTFGGDAKSEKKCPLPTQECLNLMAEKLKGAGWVGIEYEWDEQEKVMQVVKVVPGSPAESAGLQPGDRLYAVDGMSFEEREKQKDKIMKAWKPGQSVTYSLKRAGQDKRISLTLGAMPADVLARYIGQHMLEHAQVEMAKK